VRQAKTSDGDLITCGNCGRPNDDGAVFCAACNHYLAWEDAETPPNGTTSKPPPHPAPPTDPTEPSAPARPTEPTAPAWHTEPTERRSSPAGSETRPPDDAQPDPFAFLESQPPPSPRPKPADEPTQPTTESTPTTDDHQPPPPEPAARTATPPGPPPGTAPAPPTGPAKPTEPTGPTWPGPTGQSGAAAGVVAAPQDLPSGPAGGGGGRAGGVDGGQGVPASVGRLMAAIDGSRDLAGQRNRGDLAVQLESARERLESRTITAVVVGEFKRGKSTLVNALLQTAVCPVDADIVTAVPTLIRYGDQPGVTAYRQTDPDAEPVPEEAALSDIPRLVSERSVPTEDGRVQSVTVRVQHRMLRSGLSLLDTPGVGGLDSVHGQLTVASLQRADAVLFVTDAAQELTAPELDFLRTAIKRCPAAAMIVTKTDLYPYWRRIVELDQEHLAAAGIDLPVIPVSSFLRLRAVQQPELNDESGYAPLVQFLAGAVVVPATERVAATVAHEVGFVATQLAQQADAERVVLAAPKQSPQVISTLQHAQSRAAELAAATATWQQTLSDGITDLVSDVEHDLQERFRTVLRDVETIVDEGDPIETWPDIEVWLRRQVAVAGVANRDLMVSRARDLSERVAETFDLEAGTGVDIELSTEAPALDSIELASATSLSMPGGRLGSLMVAARSAVYVPMVLFSIGSVLLPVVAVAGVAATLGAGIGGKLIRDERKRQRVYRQQQAKAATRRFVDEVAFVMNKETRDSLRRAQRQLRDDFQYRATVMQRSSSAALDAANRAARLTPAEQAARASRLAAEAEQLRTIRSTMREVAATGVRAAAGVATGAGIGLIVDHAIHDGPPDGTPDDTPDGDHD
jgi:hypothetical protein